MLKDKLRRGLQTGEKKKKNFQYEYLILTPEYQSESSNFLQNKFLWSSDLFWIYSMLNIRLILEVM